MTFDRDNARALIAEARTWIRLHRENKFQAEAAKRMTRLAYALEAALNLQATAVPVEGDREALNRIVVEHLPDDMHPDDQKKCICGEVIGESDGVIVTRDPYGHLIETILAAGFSRSPLPVEGDRRLLARSIVNQVLGGAVECGAYQLADMTKRQEFNDVADAFVLRLISALPVEGEVERRCGFSLDQGCLCDLPNGHTGLHECQRHRFTDRPMFGEVTP